MIKDIHTHRADAREAVISVNPWEFCPMDGLCYSVGIHPWQVGRATEADFDRLAECAKADNVLMIGECGIDKLRGGDLSMQTSVLERHIALSEQVGKPLVLHCVRASNELCRLRRALRPRMPWVVHGFRGNARVAGQLLDAGFYLSYGERFNPEALAITPADRLLAETDESLLPIDEIHRRLAASRHVPVTVLTAGISHVLCEIKVDKKCGRP